MSISELSETLGMTKTTLNRWLTNYEEIEVYDLGREKLIDTKNLQLLLQKRTKDVRESKRKQSERMKGLAKAGKLGRKPKPKSKT